MPLASPTIPSKQRQEIEFLRLDSMTWDDYQRILTMIGDRRLFVTFDGSTLEIMSPSLRHDRTSRTISRLIDIVAEELNVPVMNIGTTTLHSTVAGKGLEADEAFYITHEAVMRNRTELDLSTDPPPDLAIEVEVTDGSVARLPIYKTLGVPEIWHYREPRMDFLARGPNSEYVSAQASRHFPGVRTTEVERFIQSSTQLDPLTWTRNVREWAASIKQA